MIRRHLLKLLAGGGILATGASITGYRLWPDEGLWNPCSAGGLPESLANHELLLQAWEGINPTLYRDVHVHLIGTGDNDSGIWLNPDLRSIWHPIQNVQFSFYLNGSCTKEGKNVDINYVKRLYTLMQDFPSGAKAMLLAFEHHYDLEGKINLHNSPFHTPNSYAEKTAKQHADRFEWTASVHPYRSDAIKKLELAISRGAKAVKWLPPAMNIDPSSTKCDGFYETLAKHQIPLLSHAGDEHAVDAGELQKLGNPLLLRRALDFGVKVIIAHCATIGTNTDLDKGENGPEIENYRLFGRLMNEKKYENHLFGDISAITQINRSQEALEYIVEHDEWHHRLVQGSDYPLPGVMPVFSPQTMVERGYLPQSTAQVISEVRKYNPLLFDFLLKRYINVKGKRFSHSVFEAARIIENI
jgi:mannonate dehydratase